MIPTMSLDEAIIRCVNPKKHGKTYDATIGILFIEPGARGFFEYIEHYNRTSGKIIDFYIPGYRFGDSNNVGLSDGIVRMDLANLRNYYDRNLYAEAVEDIRLKLGFDVDRNQYPKLIISDVTIDYSVDKVIYGDRFMIDIDDASNLEPIFEVFIDCAKKHMRIHNMKIRYSIGKHTRDIFVAIKNFVREGIYRQIDKVIYGA